MNQVIIKQLKIGEFHVDTPKGLSELLAPTWSTSKDNDRVDEFASKFNRSVSRNSEGRLVTIYKKQMINQSKEGVQ